MNNTEQERHSDGGFSMFLLLFANLMAVMFFLLLLKSARRKPVLKIESFRKALGRVSNDD
ncbi:MAG: hypothetical protein KKH91_02675 [Elusimicrobia bacterium]|nr:hypothetical protein [Elusimicrobiota bacterium]